MSSSPPAHGWFAIAYGALDVEGSALFERGAEVLLVPAVPGDVLCLVGEGAALWRRLIDSAPVQEDAVSAAERVILSEMAQAGIVTRDATHPARVTQLAPPVLSSPLHELVYALTAQVAAEHGIRCVFTKGPALMLQGLREREHSGDVDVWCDPARWDDLAEALEPWGWAREPDAWRGTAVHHTATMRPERWGCEIDIHRRFPGLTIDDAAAFEIVLRDAEPLRFGAVDILVPRVSTHAVLAAIHAVRPVIGAGPRTRDISDGAARLLARAPDTLERARELGAVVALRDELAPLAAPGSLDADEGTPRDWAWRAESSRVRAYWVAMRGLSWIVRARLVIRFVWPPDDIALASAHSAGDPTDDPTRARWSRLRRGVREWLHARS
ncbi:nucleotidyltransferase family protein [Microbacterium testaceum]|uniref:nucleotidyltransferase family protein n=1 Tax=Microbacterium testaceum TaxID=2033 RepID=UPI00073480CE|nr:nucleotidyltransferase family protein [Microbacterium testaceum]